eukprot:g5501.t1
MESPTKRRKISNVEREVSIDEIAESNMQNSVDNSIESMEEDTVDNSAESKECDIVDTITESKSEFSDVDSVSSTSTEVITDEEWEYGTAEEDGEEQEEEENRDRRHVLGRQVLLQLSRRILSSLDRRISREEEEEEEDDDEEEIFDIQLPSQHSYLNLNESETVPVTNENENPELIASGWEAAGEMVRQNRNTFLLPLLKLRDVVLFPGRKLPLNMLPGPLQAHIRDMAQKMQNGTTSFSDQERVVQAQQVDENCNEPSINLAVVLLDDNQPFEIGTIVNIKLMNQSTDSNSVFRALGIGTSRFRILSIHDHRRGFSQAEVQLLQDTHTKLGAISLRWSKIILNQYDPPLLAQRVYKKIVGLGSLIVEESECKSSENGNSQSISSGPSLRDPLGVSWWAAANLPLESKLRQKLLEEDSVVRRLQLELKIIKDMEADRPVFCCCRCESPIAEAKDIFRMSENMLAAFVNPGGFVHETLTLKSVRILSNRDQIQTGVMFQGQPSEENSWFPGYAWTIAVCGVCGKHMGWRFNATRKKLQPRLFFGLSRGALVRRSQSFAEQRMEEEFGINIGDRRQDLVYDNDADEPEQIGAARVLLEEILRRRNVMIDDEEEQINE